MSLRWRNRKNLFQFHFQRFSQWLSLRFGFKIVPHEVSIWRLKNRIYHSKGHFLKNVRRCFWKNNFSCLHAKGRERRWRGDFVFSGLAQPSVAVETAVRACLMASTNQQMNKINGKPDSATQQTPRYLRISSALFYALASFLITVVNKTVLTSYRYDNDCGCNVVFTNTCVLWDVHASHLKF